MEGYLHHHVAHALGHEGLEGQHRHHRVRVRMMAAHGQRKTLAAIFCHNNFFFFFFFFLGVCAEDEGRKGKRVWANTGIVFSCDFIFLSQNG